MAKKITNYKEDKIRLGIMAPLSGLVEIYGCEISRAAQIACDEVNIQGGVLGKPLELIIVDDGSLPETAVPAANKLIDEYQCTAMIGNLLSNSRIDVVSKVAEPRKVPLLNFSFYEGSINSPYFFNFAALPNQQIDKMIPYMAENFGAKMFFAGSNYEWPRGSIDAAKRSLQKLGGEIVGEEYVPIGSDQIDKLLDHVARSGAHVFVPYFAGTDQINLLTRFTEKGLKERMAVVMGHYDETMVSLLPAHIRDGFYSVNTYFMSIETPENQAFIKRLSKYPGVKGVWPNGNGSLSNFGEGTYVCVKAFAQAVNNCGSLDTNKLIKTLENVSVMGPQGYVDMDPVTHHAKINSYLSQCNRTGEFKIIKSFGRIDPVIPERYKNNTILESIVNSTVKTPVKNNISNHHPSNQSLTVVDNDGVITYTNNMFLKMWHTNHKENILNNKFSSLWKNPGQIENILNTAKETGSWIGKQVALIDNHETTFDLTIKKLGNNNQQDKGFTISCVKDTTQTNIPTIVKNSQTTNNILSIVDVSIIATNESGDIIQSNNSASDLFGYDEHELTGMSIHLLLPPHFRVQHRRLFDQFIKSPINELMMGRRGEIAGYRKDGSEFPAEASISKFKSADGWIMVVTMRDIIDKKKTEDDLIWQATHDPLTHLPNRNLIQDRLTNALNRSQRSEDGVALLFIDLDNFKLINDSFGHKIGDQLLVGISERLSDVVRPGDTVARFGGDEFIVLCEYINDSSSIARLAERIVSSLRKPLFLNDQQIHATSSIGIAYGHGSTHSADDMLRNADSAMYTAKSKGRDGWRIFNETIHEEAKRQLSMANGLRLAVENQELELRLQPIIDTQSGNIVGAESLLRWFPESGEISPAVFIPIAEMTGSILPIGRWVFEQACKVQFQWQQQLDTKETPYLSINISTRQLGEIDLVETFSDIIKSTKADPYRIIIEITETSLMVDVESNIRVLQGLADLGMKVAVDDFGTGYSSLSQLIRMPVNTLKVDKSFVDNIHNDKNTRAIISAIIQMSHALDLKVIAEGVETEQQHAELIKLDCNCCQGYLFYKPMPTNDFMRLFDNNEGKYKSA